jgi:hypothetical protein
MRSVTRSPFGIPDTYLSIGSSSESFPCSASCMIIVPVNVLVTEPMRVCMSWVIAAPVAGSATP